jgi:hypothetical protein
MCVATQIVCEDAREVHKNSDGTYYWLLSDGYLISR